MFTEVLRGVTDAGSYVWKKAVKPCVDYFNSYEPLSDGHEPVQISLKTPDQYQQPWWQGLLAAFAKSGKSVYTWALFGAELLALEDAMFLNWIKLGFVLGVINTALGGFRSFRGERVHHTDALTEIEEILNACLLLSKDLVGDSKHGLWVAAVFIFSRLVDPDLTIKSKTQLTTGVFSWLKDFLSRLDFSHSMRALGHRSLAAIGEFSFDKEDSFSKRSIRGLLRGLHMLANALIAGNSLRRFFNFAGPASSSFLRFTTWVVFPIRGLIALATRWLELKIQGSMNLNDLSQKQAYNVALWEGIYAAGELAGTQGLYIMFGAMVLLTGKNWHYFSDDPWPYLVVAIPMGLISAIDANNLFKRNIGHRTATILKQLSPFEPTPDNAEKPTKNLQVLVDGGSLSRTESIKFNPLTARRQIPSSRQNSVLSLG